MDLQCGGRHRGLDVGRLAHFADAWRRHDQPERLQHPWLGCVAIGFNPLVSGCESGHSEPHHEVGILRIMRDVQRTVSALLQ